jgi:hypothetical protein
MISSLKTVVLGAIAFVMMSAVTVGAASAAPVAESCREGAAGTKFTSNQCIEASGSGTFGWEEIKNTEAGRAIGTVRLTDTNVPIVGKVTIVCTAETRGAAGPGRFARINEISNVNCTAGEHCEKIEGAMEPLHLPYQGELFETEKKVEGKTTGTGGGEPALRVTCRVLGVNDTDECTYTVGNGPEIGSFENKSTKKGTITELLVVLTALKVSKQNCSIGGAKSGEQEGSGALLSISGAAGRVS